MLTRHFAWKLYAGIVVLILISTTVVSLLLHRAAMQSSTHEIQHALRNEATYLTDLALPALEGGDSEALTAKVTRLGKATGTRLTVIDVNGVVLADSNEDPKVMENHASRPEVIAARNYGEGTSTRFSVTLQQRMMYFALPVKYDGALIGFARAALPLTAVDRRLALLRTSVLIGMAVALVLSLPLGYIFARLITKPLTAMTAAARQIAAGEYGMRIRKGSSDEFGLLVDALNEMSGNLERRVNELAGERHQLEAILSSMREAVVATDKDERVVHINASAARICSVKPEEAEGLRSWEAIRLPELNALIQKALGDAAVHTGELTLTGADGDKSYSITVTPWFDAAGTVVGAVAVLHDVSRQRQVERMRQTFIANASHELKTPLTSIAGFAETMLEDEQMPAETRRQFLQNIHEDAGRLSRLVMDMLALSRAESKASGSDLEPLDLRTVASNAIDPLAARAAAQGVELVAELQEDAVMVKGDHDSLVTAVSNLIDNALNYTPAGGGITVSVVAESSKGIVEVCDTGCGIAPEHLGRIFERFYRVDDARSRKLGGTGLGLAIVKHTALNHGGNVQVESTVGRGSTFSIELPLIQDQT